MDKEILVHECENWTMWSDEIGMHCICCNERTSLDYYRRKIYSYKDRFDKTGELSDEQLEYLKKMLYLGNKYDVLDAEDQDIAQNMILVLSPKGKFSGKVQ